MAFYPFTDGPALITFRLIGFSIALAALVLGVIAVIQLV